MGFCDGCLVMKRGVYGESFMMWEGLYCSIEFWVVCMFFVLEVKEFFFGMFVSIEILGWRSKLKMYGCVLLGVVVRLEWLLVVFEFVNWFCLIEVGKVGKGFISVCYLFEILKL